MSEDEIEARLIVSESVAAQALLIVFGIGSTLGWNVEDRVEALSAIRVEARDRLQGRSEEVRRHAEDRLDQLLAAVSGTLAGPPRS